MNDLKAAVAARDLNAAQRAVDEIVRKRLVRVQPNHRLDAIEKRVTRIERMLAANDGNERETASE